jgi:ornithine decarboxylase
MEKFISVASAVSEISPQSPLFVYRPDALAKAVGYFRDNFRGSALYAVKTNPETHVLRDAFRHGIKNFDVASLEEVRLVHKTLPAANMYFMHTVKSRDAIHRSYFEYGVKNFSLDCEEELNKIVEETEGANDLNLFVRLAIPNSYAELNLANKFGIAAEQAVGLLKATRAKAAKLGVCFHVGSQCMHPDAYRIAMRIAKRVIKSAKVKVDILDIGGGFPSIYPGMTPPPMADYFKAIHEEFANFGNDVELLAEPGRALVAESGAVIARVILRKGENLYINEGTYGSLFDAGIHGFVYPVRQVGIGNVNQEDMQAFSFYGPTCDSLDFMKGPFYLPENIKEGDYIEIGQLGAYGKVFTTGFNGFVPEKEVAAVEEAPILSMYPDERGISWNIDRPAYRI